MKETGPLSIFHESKEKVNSVACKRSIGQRSQKGEKLNSSFAILWDLSVRCYMIMETLAKWYVAKQKTCTEQNIV